MTLKTFWDMKGPEGLFVRVQDTREYETRGHDYEGNLIDGAVCAENYKATNAFHLPHRMISVPSVDLFRNGLPDKFLHGNPGRVLVHYCLYLLHHPLRD